MEEETITDRPFYPVTLYGPSWTRTTKYRKGHGGRELSHTGRTRLFSEARSQRWRQGVEEEDPVGLWIMLFCAFALRLFCFFRLECEAFHGGFGFLLTLLLPDLSFSCGSLVMSSFHRVVVLIAVSCFPSLVSSIY